MVMFNGTNSPDGGERASGADVLVPDGHADYASTAVAIPRGQRNFGTSKRRTITSIVSLIIDCIHSANIQ